MKTAGMTRGTPDWQLDLMVGAESSKLWRQLNTETDGETLRQAARSLRFVIEDLDTACDNVNEAAETLVDTPEGDRVRSILDDMEKVLEELKTMEKKWGAA